MKNDDLLAQFDDFVIHGEMEKKKQVQLLNMFVFILVVQKKQPSLAPCNKSFYASVYLNCSLHMVQTIYAIRMYLFKLEIR